MKTTICLFSLIFLIAVTAANAQSYAAGIKEPCYSKHWADSANQATTEQLKSGYVNPVNWYAYEGQAEEPPSPSQITNVIYIKLGAECPVEKAGFKGEQAE